MTPSTSLPPKHDAWLHIDDRDRANLAFWSLLLDVDLPRLHRAIGAVGCDVHDVDGYLRLARTVAEPLPA